MRKNRRFGLVLAVSALLLAPATTLAVEDEKPEKKTKTQLKSIQPVKPEKAPVESPYHAATRKSTPPAAGEETVVITNEYLQKMISGMTELELMSGVYQAERHIGAPADDAAPGSGESAPGAAGETGEAREDAPPPATSAEPTKSVAELNAKVQELQRRLLALKNPLLPRRYSEKTDEEDEEWDEKSNVERIESTEAELAAAQAELAEAQKKSGSR